MADRQVLFTSSMVRALLGGRKTQTRRVLHVQPPEWVNFCEQPQMFNVLHQWVPSGLWRWAELDECQHRALRQWPIDDEGGHYWLRPRFAVDDRLYVREAWRTVDALDHVAPSKLKDGEAFPVDYTPVRYEADGVEVDYHPLSDPRFGKLRPGMFMPRWASRLTLIVTDVRVQRLQEISRGDAMEEGCPFANMAKGPDPRDWYAALWDGLNAKRGYGWDVNPWIAAVSFETHRGNIDRLPVREPS